MYIYCVKIKISKHAREQAAARGITEDGIRAILAERPVVMISSNYDDEANIVLGMYENKKWAVVYNPYALNVITVRRARKKEEAFYDEKKKNRPDIL